MCIKMVVERSPDKHGAEEGSAKLKFDFVPGNFMAQELLIQGRKSDYSNENMIRRDLSVGKIAEVCQLDVDQA